MNRRVRLPDTIGNPAINEDPSERFVLAPFMALHDGSILERAVRAEDSLPDMTEAQKALARAAMPRSAGIIALGSGLVGAYDLQAGAIEGSGLAVQQQRKVALDEETKQPREPGILVFSVMHLNRQQKLARFYSKVVGFALNPDEDPWLADELGVDRRWRQNEYGMIIASTEPFAEGGFVVRNAEKSAQSASRKLILPRAIY